MSDYERDVIIDLLDGLLWALDQIEKRFESIDTSAEFLDTDIGLEKLDSICMQLINIGEALKRIDKMTDRELLRNYPQIEWKKVMGMRDIITHHYFDIDAETVFTVCDELIPKLHTVIFKIKEDISESYV